MNKMTAIRNLVGFFIRSLWYILNRKYYRKLFEKHYMKMQCDRIKEEHEKNQLRKQKGGIPEGSSIGHSFLGYLKVPAENSLASTLELENETKEMNSFIGEYMKKELEEAEKYRIEFIRKEELAKLEKYKDKVRQEYSAATQEKKYV